MEFESTIKDQSFEIDIDETKTRAIINKEEVPFEIISGDNGRFLFKTGTKMYKIDNISRDNKEITFSLNGTFLTASVKDGQDLLLEKLGFKSEAEVSVGDLKAPMPGKILDILVKEGDEVALGDPVMILEAMKMENELKSPADGILEALHVEKGDNVEKNQLLLEISPRG
jgi:pyruvate carboxylase subunit B